MKVLLTISRLLLGLIFIVFGLNGLYTFIPVPEYHPFMEIMVSTRFIVVVKVFEIISGILLVSGRFTVVALIILGPIVVNILLYHLFIDPRNMAVGFVNLLLYSFLAFSYRSYFGHLFECKPKPDYI